MEKERGIVERADQQRATIRVEKSSHCATCGSRDTCHSFGENEMRIEVVNTPRAKTGDLVEIAIPTRTLLKLSLIVYLGPILLLIAGAFAGQQWAHASLMDPTLPSVIWGLGAMGVSFLLLKWLDRKMRGKSSYSPRILRIVSSGDSLECDDSK
ncbi:MAG: SoxR reducing system RseC family protein [Desulfatiglandales bacterium]